MSKKENGLNTHDSAARPASSTCMLKTIERFSPLSSKTLRPLPALLGPNGSGKSTMN